MDSRDTADIDAPGARATLPAGAADRLRELIIEGELAPGTRLNERALGERLGISRTPLREALRVLAAEGLVILHPKRGAQVVRLSGDDIRESFEVMSALEALSGELACQRITDAELAEIKALTFELLACHARADLPAYYRLNRQVHDRINAAARNTLLRQTYRNLNLRIQNLRFRSNFERGKWDRAARDHLAMVEALEARDAPRLAALLRSHLYQKGEAVLAQLMAEAPAASEPPNVASAGNGDASGKRAEANGGASAAALTTDGGSTAAPARMTEDRSTAAPARTTEGSNPS